MQRAKEYLPKFVPRGKFRRRCKAKRHEKVHLWTNYSSQTLTTAQSKFLDLGLNFVVLPQKFNRTEVEASMMQWERTMRWKEYWYSQRQKEQGESSSDGDDDEVEIETTRENIFKDKALKTNLPRKHSVPAALTSCISATRYSVLGAKLTNTQPNIPADVGAAGKDLVTLQRERCITIKPSDKTGGVCIMDFDDYKEGMDIKLKEKFTDRGGEEKDKYVKCSEKQLRTQWQEIKKAVTKGRTEGIISDDDANLMVPEKPKPGRLYGLVKDHKPLAPDSNIPKLREVVSGSGSNTEYISAFVDHYAKSEVQKLPSYLEDTPDVLRKIQAKNRNGPLPPGAIPVVMDISAT